MRSKMEIGEGRRKSEKEEEREWRIVEIKWNSEIIVHFFKYIKLINNKINVIIIVKINVIIIIIIVIKIIIIIIILTIFLWFFNM